MHYAIDGLMLQGDRLKLKLARFVNHVDDYIGMEQAAADTPECEPSKTFYGCYQRQNANQARIKGYELEASYDLEAWYAGLGLSLTNSYTKGVEDEKDWLVPSSQATVRVGYRLLDNRLTLGGKIQYNWISDNVKADAKDKKPLYKELGMKWDDSNGEDYGLVNLSAVYQATDTVRLDLAVNNLFDTNYLYRGIGYGSGASRSLVIGMNVRFGG